MMHYRILLLLSTVSGCFGQTCTSCSCYQARSAPVSINSVVKNSPLYVYAISPKMLYDSVDSICFDFSKIAGLEDMNTTFVQADYTAKDMTKTESVFIESEIMQGLFSGVGTSYPDFKFESYGSVAYKDYIITMTCDNTYLIYRCYLVGMTCPIMKSMATIMIASSLPNERPECIDNSKVYAQYFADFDDVSFVDLPMTSKNPCPAPIPSPSSSSSSYILKLGGSTVLG